MNLLLDTNIILNIVRAKDYEAVKNFVDPEGVQLYISIVSRAEIESLAIRNKWGVNRINILKDFLQKISIVDINESFVSIYAEIDAFSQRLTPGLDNYPFDTPRNMGKNDLWIASLANLLNLNLITTEADFDHLHKIFFEVRKINPAEFVSFF
jgi:tRNA(fMet)-specific endonuclease VapC